jgi:hypothetical protein
MKEHISGLSEWSSFPSTGTKLPSIVHQRKSISDQHSAQEGMGAQLLPFDIKLSTMFRL